MNTDVLAAYPRISRPCVCGCAEGARFAHLDRHAMVTPLRVCAACGLARTDPYLTDDAIADFYANHYRALYDTEGPERIFADGFVKGRMLRDALGVPDSASIIDYGSGAGGLLCAFDQRASVVGIEPGEYAQHARSHGSDVVVMPTSATVAPADYVFAIHTLEHRADLAAALADHRRLVAPGGRLVAEVPTLESIGPTYRSLSAYLQLPHIWHFTRATFVRTMVAAGFTPLRGSGWTLIEFSADRSEASGDANADVQETTMALLKLGAVRVEA